MASINRFCSLIPGFGVKLSAIILAGPTVLPAVGACPPHDDGSMTVVRSPDFLRALIMMPLWPTSAAKPTPGGPCFEARGFTVFFSCPSNASAKA